MSAESRQKRLERLERFLRDQPDLADNLHDALAALISAGPREVVSFLITQALYRDGLVQLLDCLRLWRLANDACQSVSPLEPTSRGARIQQAALAQVQAAGAGSLAAGGTVRLPGGEVVFLSLATARAIVDPSQALGTA